MSKNKGKLYLIPSTIGDSKVENVIPAYNKIIINRLDEFIVEEIRTARRFLRKAGFDKNFDNITFHILNEHTQIAKISNYIESAVEGKDIGLLSDAGVPCIADPGAEIVRIAQQKNIRVVPLTGPSSIMLALMASGFNGQNFTFHGYLPIERNSRKKKIKEIENSAYRLNQTQIFIETPYRNVKLFDALLNTCSDQTLLCIACDVSLDTEYIVTKTIMKWEKDKPKLHKRPVVFLLYK